jgi:plastocyanin domain-containing protein
MLKMTLAHALVVGMALAACSKGSETKGAASAESAKSAPAPAAAAPADGKIAVTVTEKGFEPDGIQVKKGTPYTFTFTRKTDSTCATEVVMQLGGGKTIDKKLPLNEPVSFEATFADSGKLQYACGMDMVKGFITVE